MRERKRERISIMKFSFILIVVFLKILELIPWCRIDKEEGPAHSKKFICSVTVGSENFRISRCGDPEPRVKYAENSAARHVLSILRLDEGKKPARIPNGPKFSTAART